MQPAPVSDAAAVACCHDALTPHTRSGSQREYATEP